MIPWRPIAELPDALKDGREVLVWTHHPLIVFWSAFYGTAGGGTWESDGGTIEHNSITRFAEIQPPDGV
jgi:hypothetical protein